jgi:hypothetical protein
MNSIATLVANWPQVLAFFVAMALFIIGVCKSLAILFAMLAVIVRLFSATASARIQWVSEFFAKLGHNAHDAFVHIGLLKDPDDNTTPPPDKPQAPPIVKIASAMLALVVVLLGATVAGLIVASAGCSAFPKDKAAEVVMDTGKEAACVIMHSDESFDQILKDCEGVEAEFARDILDAHKRKVSEKLAAQKCTGGQ